MIHSKSGPDLRSELEKFRFQKNGSSVPTDSYKHDLVKKIIHSVPPDKFEIKSDNSLDPEDSKIFKNCYTTAMDLANELKMGSIVLPLLLRKGKVEGGKVRRQMGVYAMLEAVVNWFEKKNMEIDGENCYVQDVCLQKVIFSFEPKHPNALDDMKVLAELMEANRLPKKFVSDTLE